MELKECIKRLINAHGVSGNEFEASRVALELLEPFVDRVEIDEFGNVAGYRYCGKPNAKKLMLDAHIDQVGFIVTEITNGGFARFSFIGGATPELLPGKEVIVLTKDGPLTGIVSVVPRAADMPEWNGDMITPVEAMVIDFGMTEEQAWESVEIGDFICYGDAAIELMGDIICGRAIDDRACYMAIVYAMELLKGKDLPVDVIVVGSTKEEVDGAGAKARAYRDKPDIVIALDVGGEENFGKGPIIPTGPASLPVIAERLKEVASAKQITYIPRCSPGVSGTNARHFQISYKGILTAFVSMPQKYIHSPVELVRICDIELTGRLMAEFVMSLAVPLREE